MYAGRGYRRPLTGSTFGFSLSRKGSGKFYPIFSDPDVSGSREGKGARDLSRSPGKEHIYKRAPGSSHLEPGIFFPSSPPSVPRSPLAPRSQPIPDTHFQVPFRRAHRPARTQNSQIQFFARGSALAIRFLGRIRASRRQGAFRMLNRNCSRAIGFILLALGLFGTLVAAAPKPQQPTTRPTPPTAANPAAPRVTFKNVQVLKDMSPD